MSPWLIVTMGWPAVNVMAGHALTAPVAVLLLPAAGTAVATATIGPLVLWRRRYRKQGAAPPSVPRSTS